MRAWQHGYRGMMPDDYLDGLRPDDRIEMWRDRLGHDDDLSPVLVAELDGVVAGFAALRPRHATNLRATVRPASCTRSTSTRRSGGAASDVRCSSLQRVH